MNRLGMGRDTRCAAGADVTIAALRPRDAKRCAQLEAMLFAGDDPWHAGVFHAELAQGYYYLGAYSGEELIGYAGLAVLGRPPHLEGDVHTIGVDPARQGHGVGTALLRALLAHADARQAPVFLEVRTDNESAIGMYERHGFERIGIRRGYYQPSGADAYTMCRAAPRQREES